MRRPGKRRLRPSEGVRGRKAGGLQPLNADQLLTLSSAELRAAGVDDLLRIMEELGISTEEITSKTEALTRLVQNAYSLSE